MSFWTPELQLFRCCRWKSIGTVNQEHNCWLWLLPHQLVWRQVLWFYLTMIDISKPFWQLNTMKDGLQSCGVVSRICQRMSQRRQILLSGGRYVKSFPKYKHCLRNGKDHAQLYPTLAWIALDILPCQVSSIPCEQLFSSAKQVADNRCTWLRSTKFEELQLVKFAWHNDIPDLIAWNSAEVEEVELDDFEEFLVADVWTDKFDKEVDEFIIEWLVGVQMSIDRKSVV